MCLGGDLGLGLKRPYTLCYNRSKKNMKPEKLLLSQMQKKKKGRF